MATLGSTPSCILTYHNVLVQCTVKIAAKAVQETRVGNSERCLLMTAVVGARGRGALGIGMFKAEQTFHLGKMAVVVQQNDIGRLQALGLFVRGKLGMNLVG